MPELKIGIQLRSLKLPFKKALIEASRLGAAGVEIDARHELPPHTLSHTGTRQLRKMLDDLRLKVCAISYRTRRGYDIPDDLDRRIEGTKSAMRMARDLGCPIVINHVGRIPQDVESPSFRLLTAVLSDLGIFGNRDGALLAASTGSESGEDLARLLKALPHGTMTVNLNPGLLIANGFSPLEAVEKLGEQIFHVHANDSVRDLAMGRGMEVPLGRGAVDWPALLGALEERGYRNYFTLERERSENPLFDIEQGIKYLRNL